MNVLFTLLVEDAAGFVNLAEIRQRLVALLSVGARARAPEAAAAGELAMLRLAGAAG